MAQDQEPKGVGSAVVPYSFDTQYRPSIPWLYNQTRGDVATFGMYFWDTTSALARSPGFYVMDSHTVEGKPTVIYETNQARPSPFRAEYPFRLAALASWQDWDVIFFHYWGGWDRDTDEAFMVEPMKYMTTSHFWNAVHHDQDPVMTSSFALAGRMFLNGVIPPAREYATYRVGGPGIFSFKFANGIDMTRNTIEKGARIVFEPEGDFVLKKENAGSGGPLTEAVESGVINWDWPNERLIIDAPAAKAYVGPAPSDAWEFDDGITLSGVSTPWLSFGMVSMDGKPLVESSKIYLTAVYDAQNTGFEFDWTEQGGPVDKAKAISNMGTAPIVVEKVDYTVSFPREIQWQASTYDFALRETASEEEVSNVVRIRQSESDLAGVLSPVGPQEVWMTQLAIEDHGRAMPPVVDPSPGAEKEVLAGGRGEVEATDVTLAELWNPLPGVSWGDSYALTHRKLRDGKFDYSSISSFDGVVKDRKTILMNDATAVLQKQANISVTFSDGVMRQVTISFVDPPAFGEAISALESDLGPPDSKELAEFQYEQSTVRWNLEYDAARVTVTLSDAQGIVKLSVEQE